MNNNRWLQILIILLVIIAATYLLGQVWQLVAQFSGLIGLFFAAWLLAFVLSPLARALHARGLSYTMAVGLVYLALLLVLGGTALLLFPTLANQLERLLSNVDNYSKELEAISADTEALLRSWGVRVQDLDISTIYGTIAAQVQNVGVSMLGVLTGVAGFLLNTVLVLLISFYMMKDGEAIMNNLVRLLPANFAGEAKLLTDSIARSFGGFIRGQLVFGIMYGILNAFVMLLFGLDFILIASIVAGFFMLIPLVGGFLSFIPPLLILLVNPREVGNWWLLLIVLLVVQTIMMQVVSPRIMSQAVGMHPLFVVGSMLAGAQVAGVWGAVFGIPVAGVLALVAGPFFQRLLGFFNGPEPAYVAIEVPSTRTALEASSRRPDSTQAAGGTSIEPATAGAAAAPPGVVGNAVTSARAGRPPSVVRGIAWLAAAARRRR